MRHFRRLYWCCLALLVVSSQSSWALTADSWISTTSGDLTNSAKWSPVGTPTAVNDVFITNYIGNTSIFLTNRQTVAGTGPTNGNLTIFNNAGTGVFTLLLSNSTYMVTNNTTIGTNAVVQLGTGLTTSASTFSNNNLYLAGNGAINFNAANLLTPSTLIVAGQFSNTTASAIASLNGSSAALLFTANASVTNQGSFSFTGINTGSAGNTGLVIQVGNGASTFYNQGTVTLGAAGTAASRAYVFSNQLVNAGFFVLTNNVANTTNFFSVTGQSGTALTNLAGGTIKLFTGTASSRNSMTLNNGGLVNAGTLLGESTVAGGSNIIALADPSGIFSNVAGGWVVATNNGLLIIQSGTIVNQGAMLATNAATLNLAGTVSGTGLFAAGPGATLNFSGGGSLDFNNSLSFTSGTVVVQGQFTNSQAGIYSSVGSLIITNGNLFNTSSSSMTLGANAGDKSTLTIAAGGTLYITNAANNAQFMVGLNGSGTLNLNAGGTLSVNQLLATNNVGLQTNSFFNFNGGTLITSNVAGQVAFNYVEPTNQNFAIGGNWIAAGGSNLLIGINGGAVSGSGNGVSLNAGASILVSNGAQWVETNYSRFTFSGAGDNVTVTGTGSVLNTTLSGINLGSGNGVFTVANGGFVFGQTTGIGAGGASSNDLLVVTGPGSIYSNSNPNGQGYYGFGISGASGVIISNGGTLYHTMPINGGYLIGDLGSNNFTIVTGAGSVLNLANENLQVGLGVNGSTYNNYITIANSGTVFSVGGILGRRGGQTAGIQAYSNTVTVTDPGSRWLSSAVIILGGESGNATFTNNNYEQVIVTNGGYLQTAGLLLGNGELTVAGASANDYNTLTITGPGSVISNTSTLVIGGTNSIGNSVVVTNGGAYYGNGAITIGMGGIGSNNSLNVISTTAASTFSNNGAITVGAASAANSLNIIGGVSTSTFTSLGLMTVGANAGGGNTIFATNANITTVGLLIGNGSSNNTVTVSDNTSWNMLKGQLTFGAGTGNTLVIASDSTVTNIGGVGLLGSGLTFNLTNNVLLGAGVDVVTAQVSLVGGSLTLGSAGFGGNSLTISNQTYTASGGSIIGNGSSNNTLTILPNTFWNNAAQNITVGTGAANSNSLTIIGSVLSNTTFTIGAGGAFNTLTVTNSTLLSSGNLVVGAATSNSAFVLAGSTVNVGSNTLTVGSGGGSSGNMLTVNGGGTVNGAVITNLANLFVGNLGNNNTLILTNGATLSNPTAFAAVGYANSANPALFGNTMIVAGGPNGVTSTFGGPGVSLQTFAVGYAFAVNGGSIGSNTLLISTGGIVTNVGGSPTGAGWNPIGPAFVVGETLEGPIAYDNQVIVQNGGQLWAAGTVAIGAIGAGGGGQIASNNSILINNGLVNINGALDLGFIQHNNSAVYDSSLTVTNGGSLTTAHTATSLIGGGEGNTASGLAYWNTATIVGNSAAPSVWNMNGGTLNISVGSGISNTLTINGLGTAGGAIVTNAGVVNIGIFGGGTLAVGGPYGDDQLIVTNGGWFLSAGAFTVGAQDFSNEAVIVNGGGMATSVSTILSNAGLITIGAGGGGFNTMTVTNASVWSTGLTVGNGASNNFVTVNTNATWNMMSGSLIVGTGLATGNGLLINGGIVTNAGAVTIGSGATTFGNTLAISNGASFFSGAVTVGSGGSSNNIYSVGSVGAASTVSNNGLITVGASGSGFNTMIVTNASVWSTGLTVGNGASNNFVSVNNATWNLMGGALTFGLGTGNVLAVGSSSSSVLTNIGGITMNDTGRSLFLTNATGARNFILGTGGAILLGNTPGLGNDTLTISNQTYTSSAASIIGNGSSNNTLLVLGNTVWNGLSSNVTVGNAAASGNLFQMNGGIVSNINLIVTSAGNNVLLNAGTLNVNNFVYSNGTDFVVGNGASPAALQVAVGTARFQGNVLITSNSVLTGAGTILAGTGSKVIITNGATIAPGNTIGALTVNNLVLQGGGNYQYAINNFSSGAPGDLVNVTGALTLDTALSALNPFIIDLTTLGATAANFDNSQDYSLAIASFGSLAGLAFNPNLFSINTNNFLNSIGSGGWSIAQFGTNIFLDFSGSTNQAQFVFSSPTGGNWSVAANWTNSYNPYAGFSTNKDQVRIQIGTNNLGALTMTNNGAIDLLNQLVLSSGSAGTNYLLGSSLTFTGVAAAVYQQGGGAFVLSNTVVLANTNLQFRGTGVGSVALASNITGVGQITKIGAWNLIVQGSNNFVGPVLMNSFGGTLTLANTYALGTNSLTISNGTVLATAAGTSYTVGNGWNNQSELIVGAGSLWTNVNAFTIGSNAALNNLVTISSSGTLAAAAISIGAGPAATGNGLVITNSGTVRGPLTVGSLGSTGNYYTVLGGGVASNGALTVGGSASGFNSFTLTNATLLNGGAVIVGNGSSNNTATVAGNGVWNLLGNSLTVGSGAATGNLLVVNGGTLTNGALIVGGAGAGFNQVLATNATLATAGLTIGSGSSNNTVTVQDNVTWNFLGGALKFGQGTGNVLNLVQDGTALLTNVGGIVLGGANTAFALTNASGAGRNIIFGNGGSISVGDSAGWGNNTLLLSNQTFQTGAANFIGNGSSNNTLVFMTNSAWNGGAAAFTIGTGAAWNNALTNSGGVMTNFGGVNIGATAGAVGNSVVINNGGTFSSGAVTVGAGLGASNNAYVIGNAGAAATVSNGLVTVGSAGGGFNTMTVTNATLFSAGLAIGAGSSNNTVTIQDNVTWNFLGGALKFGQGTGNGLNLVQDGTTLLTNVGGIILGGANTTFTLTNASGSPARNIILGTGGSISVGDSAGWGNNTLLLSNQTFQTGAAGFIGNGSSNNFLVVLTNSAWNGGAAALTIGTGAALNNWLTNNGGNLVNFGAVTIGATAGAGSNGLVINSGTFASGAVTVGAGLGASNNVYLVGSSGNLVTVANGLVTVGSAGGGFNTMTITNALMQSAGLAIGAGSSNNTVNIQSGVTWNFNGGGLKFGQGTGNVLNLVQDGTTLLTNVGGIILGGAGQTLALTNASGSLQRNILLGTGGSLSIGDSAGWGNNTLLLSNQTFQTAAASFIGRTGSSNNLVSLLAGTTWNAGTAALIIGGGLGTSVSNALLVSGAGAVITNIGSVIGSPGNTVALLIGGGYYDAGNTGPGATNNYSSLVISNGGKVALTSGFTWVGDFDNQGNQLVVNNGTFISASSVMVGLGINTGAGGGPGGSDSVTVTNGGFLSLASGLYVGDWMTTTDGQSSNTVTVAGANAAGSNSVLNLGAGVLWIGNAPSASNNLVLVGQGGVITNGGAVIIGGATAANNTLLITNGGAFFGGSVAIGQANLASNNAYIINGGSAGSTVSNGAITVGGAGGGYNLLTVTNATVFNSGGVTVGAGSSNNLLLVNANSGWNALNGSFTIGSGAATGNLFQINGGAVSNIATLLAAGNGNQVVLNSGTLGVGSLIYSNGTDFLVGNGVQAATLRLSNGVSYLQGNLSVTNNSVLTGTGNIVLAGGTGTTFIRSNSIISPGLLGPGILTNTGNLLLEGSATYLYAVNNFTNGAAGADLLAVSGILSNSAASANPFVINVTSLTGSNVAGQAVAFNADTTYALTIAAAAGGISNFNSSSFSLVLTNFQNAYDGLWSLADVGGTNLVLNYSSSTIFTWTNFNGSTWNSSAWTNNANLAATPVNNLTNTILVFGDNGATPYTATNDFTSSFVLKDILLTNSSLVATETLAGTTINFAGVNPRLQQNGAGVFVISNTLAIVSTNNAFQFTGAGTGTVIVAGAITNTAAGPGLYKDGLFALRLLGSNAYSGAFTMNGGTLEIDNNNALAASQLLIANAGTVSFVTSNPVMGSLAGTGNVALATGTMLSLGNDNATTNFAGNIGGAGGLLKAGAGAQSLSGTNTYTGNTVVNAGVLAVTGELLGSSNLTVTGGSFNWAGVNALTNLAVLNLAGGNANFLTNGTLSELTGASGTAVIGAGQTLQLGFGFTGATNFGGTFAGSGSLTMIGPGSNTWTGGGSLGYLTVAGGLLAISNGSLAIVNAGSPSTLAVSNGATLLVAGGAVNANNFTLAPGATLALNAGTLQVANGTFSNGAPVLVGNGATTALFAAGGGVLWLQNGLTVTNNSLLSGSGTIMAGSGLVAITSNATLVAGLKGPGTLAINGNNLWAANGRLAVEVNNFNGAQGSPVGYGWLDVLGSITNAAAAATPFAIDLTSLTGGNVPGQAVSFNPDGSYSFVIATATGGLANFGNLSALSLVLTNFQNAFDGVWSLATVGNTNLVLAYQGSQTFTWTNFNGSTWNSTAWTNSAGAAATPGVNLTNLVLVFGDNGVTPYTATNDFSSNFLIKHILLTNSSLAATETLAGTAINFAALTSKLEQDGAGAFVISNNIAVQNAANAFQFTGSGAGTVIVAGNITNVAGGQTAFTKDGAFTLSLRGSNTYSGAFTLNGGTLEIANNNALAANQLLNANAGTVSFITAAPVMGSLAGTGNVSLAAGTALSLGNDSVAATFGGVISGPGSLLKSGNGTETLSGTNTYTGATIVNAGTLAVSGQLTGTSNLTVNGGVFNWAALTPLTNTTIATLNQFGTLFFQNSGTLAAFVGTGHATVASGAVATVGFGDGATNFSGALDGAGTLLKTGAGTLTWDGNANISIASVLVNAGTLALAGNAQVNPTALTVSNSTLTVNGNAAATLNSLLVLSNGIAAINSGSLLVTNGAAPLLQVLAGGSIALNGGLLAASGTVYSNGQDFVVGNGASAATFRALAGTHLFQNNVVVTNNGVLSGTGTIVVNGGTGQTIIQNGGALSPGAGVAPGTLTESGTMVWNSGGQYAFAVDNVTGAAGSSPGWDLVQINGALTLAASNANPFVINVTSLTPADIAGSVTNFNRDSSYALTIASATLGITGFNTNALSLVLTNFQPSFDGTWSLQLAGNSLVLNYQGQTNFVWQSTSGAFSGAGNWIVNAAPPVATTNVVLYFGGTGSQQYTATNDLSGLLTKRIVLTNSSSKAQTITGQAITLAGLTPEIQQNGAGGFVLSNNLILATNSFFDGIGTGTVEADGQISGSGASLTKTGAYALVLGGVSTFTGPLIIQQGQVLLANANALSAVVVSNLVNNGLGFTNLTAAAIGGLTGPGNIALANAAGQAVALTVNGSGTYTGSLTGNGSLTKAVGGTLTLAGNNLYTGSTLVSGGVLQVSGSLASTNLTVSDGAVFNWASVTAMTNLSTVTINGGGIVHVSSDGTIGTLAGNGVLDLLSSTFQVGFGNVTTNYTGLIDGAGTLSKIGAGTFTVNGINLGTIGNLAANQGWLVVSQATWSVTGNGSGSAITVNNGGTFQIDTGTVTANNLAVNPGGALVFHSGLFSVGNAVVSNGQNFVIGNGLSAATFALASGGMGIFQNNLIVTNHATFSGSGTIIVGGGQGNVIVQSGGMIAAGTSPGTLTIVGTNIWQGGGSYQFAVNDFNGTPGNNPGWDWLNVQGLITNAASALNPFVIDLTSLAGASPGAAANFNANGNYSFVIATANSGSSFNTNAITLSTVNFQNAFDGLFALNLQGGTNLVLSYTGLTGYTWSDGNGNFSTGVNWENGVVPPTGVTNVALFFGGATAAGYTANNDLSGLVVKLLTLTNAAATVQTIAGNAFTFASLSSELDQNGSGAFVISNNIVLANSTLLAGAGAGTVTLAGNLSGPGGLTKTGAWSLVLGGSNTYSGVTSVQAGQVFVAGTYALAGSVLNNLLNGAVVFTNITTARLGGLAGSGNLSLSNTDGAAVALVAGGNNQSSVYSGVLDGNGSLAKIGAGTLTLVGSNTYLGGTIVNAGTLIAGALPNGIGGAGSSLGTGSVTIAGGTLRFGISGLLRVTNAASGSVFLNGGTLNAAEFVNQGAVASLGNTTTITSDLLNLLGGQLSVTGGQVVAQGNIVNSGVISNSNGAILSANSGSGVISNTSAGLIALAGGNLVASLITNNGVISGYGTLLASVYNNQLVVATNGGTLQLSGVARGTGTYAAGGGATLSFNGGGTISSLVTTGGTIQVVNSVLNNSGLFQNAGTLALAGGTYQTGLQFTNQATGTIRGFGTISAVGVLVNQGTILATASTPLVLPANVVNNGWLSPASGQLLVTGVFTNNGTLQSIAGVGTYSSSVVNNRAWLDSGSQNIFASNLLVTAAGYIAAGNQSLFQFAGNLLNQSTNALAWATLGTLPGTNTVGSGTKFLFSGSGVSQTQIFETAGLLLTGGFTGTTASTTDVQTVSSFGATAGFINNYALGELLLTNTTLELIDPPGPATNALFVNDLDLFGNAHLIISNNVEVYFVNSNNWSLANITLLGDAQLHQLSSLSAGLLVIPEPSVLLLWLAGAMTVWAARRRQRQR